MVDAARFKRLATQRIDSPAANALEISSRSDMVNAQRDRRLAGGRMPPVALKMV